MRHIVLSGAFFDNFNAIEKFFSQKNIESEGLTQSDLVAEMALLLDGDINPSYAHVIFYEASKCFQQNANQSSFRNEFRDACALMLKDWLKHKFCADDISHSSEQQRLYQIFEKFRFVMPAHLQNLLEEKACQTDNSSSANWAKDILGYYSKMAILMPDELSVGIEERLIQGKLVRGYQKQIKLLHDLAVMDSLGHKPTSSMSHRVYGGVIDRITESIDEDRLDFVCRRDFAVAKAWFFNEIPPLDKGVRQSHGRTSELKQILAQQGISVQDSFNAAAEDQQDSRLVDFVAKLGRNRQVGIILEGHKDYVERFDMRGTFKPDGSSYLETAFFERAYPDRVAIRIKSTVSGNLSGNEFSNLLHEADNLKSGVYGVNSQRELIPFWQLTIAA